MCSIMPCSNVQIKSKKQACLFKGFWIPLLMVLIAGLECRLLTVFSLWLDSIIARRTC